MEYKDPISVGHFFSKSNITSELKRKIEIKLFIQSDFASGSRLMGIICIHLMIHFLECMMAYGKWSWFVWAYTYLYWMSGYWFVVFGAHQAI